MVAFPEKAQKGRPLWRVKSKAWGRHRLPKVCGNPEGELSC